MASRPVDKTKAKRSTVPSQRARPVASTDRADKAQDEDNNKDKNQKSKDPWWQLGLPGRLLLLTALFVMLAEVLIFVPSVANFRVNWLKDRLTAAKLAGLAALASPDGNVPATLKNELLTTAEVKSVAWRKDGRRQLLLPINNPTMIDATYDLRSDRDRSMYKRVLFRLDLIADALSVLFRSNPRTLRIVGPLGKDPNEFIEVILPEAPLRQAMIGFGLNILGLSIIISLFTAALVYFALSNLLVRPLMRITENMLHFGKAPEDTSRIIEPSSRTDEVGTAERELAAMQSQLSQLIHQKTRLAQLGLAVSKINHDLRNMLASAQLISDRLSALPDPTVQRFAPKLIASLDRAINFCNDTLKFGRAEEATPRREIVPLRPIVEEIADGLASKQNGIKWMIDVDDTVNIDADREHTYRVLSNICRNAVQALKSQKSNKHCKIRIKGWRDRGHTLIEVRDNGPGLSPRARENLFQPFQGSERKGGSGLGLVIAHELVTAHGGTLKLLDTTEGTALLIDIPDRKAH